MGLFENRLQGCTGYPTLSTGESLPRLLQENPMFVYGLQPWPQQEKMAGLTFGLLQNWEIYKKLSYGYPNFERNS